MTGEALRSAEGKRGPILFGWHFVEPLEGVVALGSGRQPAACERRRGEPLASVRELAALELAIIYRLEWL